MSQYDRRLLEMAAKAAGIRIAYEMDGWPHITTDEIYMRPWNPLTEDADALRLANTCNLSITRRTEAVFVVGDNYVSAMEDYGNNLHAATRRAIVRAAAQIGEQMP